MVVKPHVTGIICDEIVAAGACLAQVILAKAQKAPANAEASCLAAHDQELEFRGDFRLTGGLLSESP